MLQFSLLDKNNFVSLSKDLFDILALNMSVIAPTGNTYEEDYRLWFEAVNEGLNKEARQIILIYCNNLLIGFFQYYTNNDLFMMEEVQISPQFHGKDNIFRGIFRFVLSVLPCNIQIIEAYANKQNEKSQKILQRLGLIKIGENKNGNSYHYRGEYRSLIKWYQRP